MHEQRGLRAEELETRLRLLVLAETDDALDAGGSRQLRQLGVMRIVAIDDRRTAGFDAEENFRLGAGDGLHVLEVLEMDRLDGGDDGDVRAHHPDQRLDLAGMVHADFKDPILRIARHARQSQRNAPVVVE